MRALDRDLPRLAFLPGWSDGKFSPGTLMNYEATLLRVAGTDAEKRTLDLQTKRRGARGMERLDILGFLSLDPAAIRDALI